MRPATIHHLGVTPGSYTKPLIDTTDRSSACPPLFVSHTHARTYACTYACIHVCTHAHIYTLAHAHAHMHAHTHDDGAISTSLLETFRDIRPDGAV